MIKFLCKDVWTLVFRKQIDNLKTNHRVRRPISFPSLSSPFSAFFPIFPSLPSRPSLSRPSLPFFHFPLSDSPFCHFSRYQCAGLFGGGVVNWLMMACAWIGRLRPNRQCLPPARAHEHGQSRGGGGEGAAGMFPSPFFFPFYYEWLLSRKCGWAMGGAMV